MFDIVIKIKPSLNLEFSCIQKTGDKSFNKFPRRECQVYCSPYSSEIKVRIVNYNQLFSTKKKNRDYLLDSQSWYLDIANILKSQ